MRSNTAVGFTAALLCFSQGLAVAAPMNMRNVTNGLEIGLGMGVVRTYGDNFFYESEGGRTVSGLLLAPSLYVRGKQSRTLMTFNAGAQRGMFDLAGSDSDFTDSQLAIGLDYDGGLRHFFSLSASTARGHDPFGTDRTETDPFQDRDMDQWSLKTAEANYRFGAPTAKLNLELGVKRTAKDYTTNEAATRFLNFGKTSLSQVLFFNYSPKTSILFELSEDFVGFEDNSAGVNRDAAEYRVRTGLRWKATAKTTGDVRAGVVRREREDSSFRPIDGESWSARITWEPLVATSLEITTERNSVESYIPNVSVIDSRSYSAKLTQGLGRNFRTSITAKQSEQEFVGITRIDDGVRYAAAAAYIFRNSLELFAEADWAERDSTVAGIGFDVATLVAGVRFSP